MQLRWSILILFLLLAGIQLPGQGFDYGNGWYQPAQTYVKYLVWEDGIYKIQKADLIAAGVPVTTINPNNFHLYYRGIEQHIYVTATSGEVDEIEFYGRHNDGRLDSTMYRDASLGGRHGTDLQPDPEISIYTDSSAYFLTWDNTAGLRVSTSNANNFSSFTPESSFRFVSRLTYDPENEVYVTGGGSNLDFFHNLNSDFTAGEGYLGEFFNQSIQANEDIPTRKHLSSVGNPSVWAVRVARLSSSSHQFELRIDNTLVTSPISTGIDCKTFSGSISKNLGNQTSFNFRVPNPNNKDFNFVCWASMEYDHAFDLDNGTSIEVSNWSKSSASYFRFINADQNSGGVIWDLTNHIRITGFGSADTLRAIVPAVTKPSHLFVATDKSVQSPLFRQHRLSNQKDVNNSAQMIIICHRELEASAQNYKAYRENNPHNQMSTKVVLVESLYDEFGYGSLTPLAIKRFCKYAYDNWAAPPDYVLLWGKGRNETRKGILNYIPTIGFPASDYLFVSNFDPNTSNIETIMSIGRVNIYTNESGDNYLNKVMQYESTPWERWMKNAVVLGGGKGPEINTILTHQNRFKQTFTGSPNGGKVFYNQKKGNGVLANHNLTTDELMEEGIGLIHFFGHSSTNSFDVDIKPANQYQNWGKYPLLVGFGCNGGNFASSLATFGEYYVTQPGRGAIGYIANSSYGVAEQMGRFGDMLFEKLYDDQYGNSIGEAIKEVMKEFNQTYTDHFHRNHARQINLQGDPSVKLYNPGEEDLSIEPSGFILEPEDLDVGMDSFKVTIIVDNLGKALEDSFNISITQSSAQASIQHPPVRVPGVYYRDTFTTWLFNTQGQKMVGLNDFNVVLDADNEVTEITKSNNTLIQKQLVAGRLPAIVYPTDLAIVPDNQVTLKAGNISIDKNNDIRFIFQMDTTPDFRSPAMTYSGIVSGSSTMAEWTPPVTLENNRIYYWRVRLADVVPDQWAEASFQYIQGRTGWSQSSLKQFKRSQLSGIRINDLTRTWEFDDFQWSLNVSNGFSSNSATYFLNGGEYKSELASLPFGIYYVAFDGKSLIPSYLNSPINGGVGDWNFLALPGSLRGLSDDILNAKDGDYFLITPRLVPRISTWPDYLFKSLEKIGCTNNVKNLSDTDPFIILGRKGANVGEAIEILKPNVGDSNTASFRLQKDLVGQHSSGTITSPMIGPAVNWEELVWDWTSLDPFAADKNTFEVKAFSPDLQNDTLVFRDIGKGTFDLSSLDAKRWPWMEIRSTLSDTVYYSPPQAKLYRVFYESAADAAVDPAVKFEFLSDTLDDGEMAKLTLHVSNLSASPFKDSLLVGFKVRREDRSLATLPSKRYGILAANAGYDMVYEFETGGKNLAGEVSLEVELNPGPEQAELNAFNNYYSVPFYVRRDNRNPLLDVTFDGRHLMDGDLVTPDPEIQIRMIDENSNLPLGDSLFTLQFGEEGIIPQMQYIDVMNDARVEHPGWNQNEKNGAQIIFRPGKLPDGEYRLEVQGEDQSGNEAGESNYAITFEVVNESAVSQVLNYPNPFSTSTQFVYTLTGDVVPEVFEIQIFTISGRLIKIIDLAAMGEIRIGKNITDYSWDGRDEFGDLLANGVYIYKTKIKLNGELMEDRDEGIGQYFKAGIGKMYILR